MAYKLYFTKQALKTFGKLPPKLKMTIRTKIGLISEDPFAPHPNVKRLKGWEKGYYRLRIGDWRIIYKVDSEKIIVIIVKIGQRKDIYEK